MTAATVNVDTSQVCVRIAVCGEIDVTNAALVHDEIFAAISEQAPSLSVDLTNLSYLDSSGLAILFRLAEHLATWQIPIELLARPHSQTRSMIVHTGLDALIRLRTESP